LALSVLLNVETHGQPSENGVFELVNLPRDTTSGEVSDSSSEGKRGTGQSALFVARNRFAVLDKTTQQIEIRDLSNSVTKTIKCPVQTNDMFYGGTASLLLSAPTSVVLFDIQQQKTVAEITTPPVKYVVWSNDGSLVALLSKHSKSAVVSVNGERSSLNRELCAAIMITDKNLGQSNLVHETIRIKSGAWDDSGVFVYSTLNHIKYALPNG
jgi:coatomer protein complex subunit alpha (xenin)